MAFSYKPYEESDTVKQAYELLQQQISQKPGEYQSSWQTQLDENLKAILNRDKFTYDMNADALYQQYKDQYTNQGKLAMMDTMGQAQAMTGGYGNSYAQAAGQQAYQGYLQELNGKVPELYSLALSAYELEGDQLSENLGLMQDQENQAYDRYMDSYSQWLTERDTLADRYDSERDYDYSQWSDARDHAFDVAKEEEANRQWQAEFDETVRQFDIESSSATSSDSGSGGSSSYSGNGGVDAATVKAAQNFVGTTADGMWGSNSAAAAAAKGYGSLSEVIAAMNGGNGSDDSSSSGLSSIEADLNTFIAGGASKSKISAYINQAKSAGLITQAEANALRSTYVPKGNTY